MLHKGRRHGPVPALRGLLVAAVLAAPPLANGEEGPAWRIVRGEVRVACPMTVGGAFEAKTTSLEGTLTMTVPRPATFGGALSVDLASLDTGVSLRDEHLRNTYLEVARGDGFDRAVLSEVRLGDVDARGFRGRTPFTGAFLLHGVKKAVAGQAEIRPEAGRVRVEARFPVTLADHGIAKPRYLGVGVKSIVEVNVSLVAEPAGAGPPRDAVTRRFLFVAAALAAGAPGLDAEPMFLSKQYTRCTSCHFSPTGGGLLTPYGRSLSRELSTTGRTGSTASAGPGEEGFLWGLLGDRLGPVSLGIDVRRAHLRADVYGFKVNDNFFMNADLLAALRVRGFTVYGEIGRQSRGDEVKVDSYEHWVGYEAENGIGVRMGRFLPAFGIRLADHTALTREGFGLDVYDQLYAVELSHRGEFHLLQLAAGPGRADSMIEDDGLKAFTASARYQRDLGARSVLVVSGLFRDRSTARPWNAVGGVALGLAPASRLSIWTELDAQPKPGTASSPSLTILNETAFEVYRGLWLKLAPQLQTQFGSAAVEFFRLAVEADLLPRTHWNVGVSWYRDWERRKELVSWTLLAQLHVYP